MDLSAVFELIRFPSKFQDLRLDSRNVHPGDLFVAVPGWATDGRHFVQQAVRNGAAAVLIEQSGQDKSRVKEYKIDNACIIPVPKLREYLPDLAACFYDNPSHKIKVIGVTGTNGKTSICHYIAQLFGNQQINCGVMGTLGNGLLPNLVPAQLTTSDCCTVQRQLFAFNQLQVPYVAMEVTSHALNQDRLNNTKVSAAIFSNVTQDHLDYHGDMQSYFITKSKLFSQFAPEYAIINLDDEYGRQLLSLLLPRTTPITYSLFDTSADVYLERETVYTPWGSGVLQTSLVGKFNLSNTLAAVACCAVYGMPLAQLLNAACNLTAVAGRMQPVTSNASTVQIIVDYAHTPDALSKVLQTLLEYKAQKLYCIVGCGGDRDRSKRPLMLRAALEYSDYVIVTQDNPRTEDPQQIIHDMLNGLDAAAQHKINIELDRAKAIQHTIMRAGDKDIILIAGKGHEEYQIIGTTKLPFSDLLVAEQALELRSEQAWIE